MHDSVGSERDSCNTALAETIRGPHQAGLICRREPWKFKESIELAWASWFNNLRLLASIGYFPRLQRLRQTTTCNSPVVGSVSV